MNNNTRAYREGGVPAVGAAGTEGTAANGVVSTRAGGAAHGGAGGWAVRIEKLGGPEKGVAGEDGAARTIEKSLPEGACIANSGMEQAPCGGLAGV